ncbi:MAG: hypothetical protein ACK2U1_26130 [Anaerolineales bacterium]|jgi:hypothetical protein
MKIFILSTLMIALLSLAACSSVTIENTPIATRDQQTDVYIPVVGKDVSENDELVSDEESEAYPDLEPETQYQEIEVVPHDSAYPDPESDQVSIDENENSQEEANPLPLEEPIEVIKPTPRGNELVATDPSTINLASGQLQLVELFAFW